jgi:hypothetical protein
MRWLLRAWTLLTYSLWKSKMHIWNIYFISTYTGGVEINRYVHNRRNNIAALTSAGFNVELKGSPGMITRKGCYQYTATHTDHRAMTIFLLNTVDVIFKIDEGQ